MNFQSCPYTDWELWRCSLTPRQEPSLDAKQVGTEESTSCFPLNQGHIQWATQNNATVSWEYQGLVQCLGTGHIRHLVAYNCQETQRERESETDWWPGEITSVSHDLCQLSQKDEMPKGKNLNSAKQPITDGASVSSGIQMHCNKGAGPLPPTCTRNSHCGGEQCPPGKIIRQWFFPLKGSTVGCLQKHSCTFNRLIPRKN